MATKVVDYDRFMYIVYDKTGKTDLQDLKDFVERLVHQPVLPKDIILDVSRCALLISPEIGFVAKILSFVEMNHRYLRMIANGVITKTLDNLSLTRKNNLVIYPNVQAFTEDLKNAGKSGLGAPEVKIATTVVELAGSLSGEEVKKMSAQVENALKEKNERVIMDLSKVVFCDSMCLAQFMYLDGVAKNQKKTLAITSAREDVLELLSNTNLDKLLEIIPASEF